MERVEDSVAVMEDNFAKALKRIQGRLESLEHLPTIVWWVKVTNLCVENHYCSCVASIRVIYLYKIACNNDFNCAIYVIYIDMEKQNIHVLWLMIYCFLLLLQLSTSTTQNEKTADLQQTLPTDLQTIDKDDLMALSYVMEGVNSRDSYPTMLDPPAAPCTPASSKTARVMPSPASISEEVGGAVRFAVGASSALSCCKAASLLFHETGAE